ncbi:MAG: hypothetical protein WBM69_00975 [Desulfobacterales bacterium]
MNDVRLKADISARYQPFLDKILKHHQDLIHSVHIVGSALTQDFDPKTSDINSVVVLGKMDLKFLGFLAPLGKKYGRKRIAAPLIMTPEYIDKSLDVFPIEFFNIRQLHVTVFGEDVFQPLDIRKSDLRRQCEQELKVKLIGLRQRYISAAGDQKILAREFSESFSGYMPLFKSIILLFGKEPPCNNADILSVLEEVSGVRTEVFKIVLNLKKKKTKPSIEQLTMVFEDYYAAIENLEDITDALAI